MNILALDVATHCGWCMDKQLYGVWDLSPKRDESKGMRLFRFKAKLNEIAKEVKLDAIVFERPAGFHKNALIVEAEIVGVLKLWCEENKIEYRAYSAGEIKKFATGCGNCSKDLMVEAAQDKLGMIGDDDNEADAMWLWQLAKKDLEG